MLVEEQSYENPNYTAFSYTLSHHLSFGPDILLSTRFSNTFSLSFFLNVRGHVLHAYTCKRRTKKISFTYAYFWAEHFEFLAELLKSELFPLAGKFY
jgi:hypothetical protein